MRAGSPGAWRAGGPERSVLPRVGSAPQGAPRSAPQGGPEGPWLLTAPEALALCGRLRAALGRGGQPVCTLLTTVYFDTPRLTLARRALAFPSDCVEVRTRECFPDCVDEDVARVRLEVRRLVQGQPQTRRVWVERAALARVLAGGARALPWVEGPSLSPQLAMTLRRRVYEQPGAWRVTVDDQRAWYPVTVAQALGAQPLSARRLGTPHVREAGARVRVEQREGPLPEGLGLPGGARRTGAGGYAEGMRRLFALP